MAERVVDLGDLPLAMDTAERNRRHCNVNSVASARPVL